MLHSKLLPAAREFTGCGPFKLFFECNFDLPHALFVGKTEGAVCTNCCLDVLEIGCFSSGLLKTQIKHAQDLLYCQFFTGDDGSGGSKSGFVTPTISPTSPPVVPQPPSISKCMHAVTAKMLQLVKYFI